MKITGTDVCSHLQRVLFLLYEEHGDQESCCKGSEKPRGDGGCDPLTSEVKDAIFRYDADEEYLKGLVRRLLDLQEDALDCCNTRPYESEACDEARLALGMKLDTDCWVEECRNPAVWKTTDPAPGNRSRTESGPLAWTHVLQPLYFWCEAHKPSECVSVPESFPVADIEWFDSHHRRPQGSDGRILPATNHRPPCLLGHKIVKRDDEFWCESTNDFLGREKE